MKAETPFSFTPLNCPGGFDDVHPLRRRLLKLLNAAVQFDHVPHPRPQAFLVGVDVKKSCEALSKVHIKTF
jgi:hypothetical protein